MSKQGVRKRTQWQREADMADLSAKLRRGWNCPQFAKALGPGLEIDRPYVLTRQQVQYDKEQVVKRWKESAAADITAEKGRILDDLDELRREYEQAWLRSCQPLQHKRSSKTGKPGKGQDGAALTTDERTLAEVRTQQRDGNPEFLKGIRDCLHDRAEVLQLAPKGVKITGNGPRGEVESHTVIDLGDKSPAYAQHLGSFVAGLFGAHSPSGNGNGAGGHHPVVDGIPGSAN